jgi:hypothetical protein
MRDDWRWKLERLKQGKYNKAHWLRYIRGPAINYKKTHNLNRHQYFACSCVMTLVVVWFSHHHIMCHRTQFLTPKSTVHVFARYWVKSQITSISSVIHKIATQHLPNTDHWIHYCSSQLAWQLVRFQVKYQVIINEVYQRKKPAMVYFRCAQILQKSKSYLQILDATTATWSKLLA